MNEPALTALTRIVPFPISADAFAVVGVYKGVVPVPQVGAGTIVVVVDVAQVNVPTALERPSAYWLIPKMILR